MFIDQLGEWKEGSRLEFKSAKGGFPKSFWETYSAFANTEGGLIVLGVEETPDGLKAGGLSNASALVQDLWNGLNNLQKVSSNLLVESDVAIEDYDGVPIVCVKVPRADRSQRPVYINNNMNQGTFRRGGEGDYRCSMEAISAMVRDNSGDALDKEPLEDVDLDALDDDSVSRYRNEFASSRLGHPWASLPRDEFLLRLGAIGRSKADGHLHPTKAGLLMFGQAWRITDAFPNYFLDCRIASESRRWDDRITSDSGEWSGNVYDFWNKASRMLCEDLPVPFELDSQLSRVAGTPQHEAIREALTNALVHADYYGRTGLVAVRSDTVVEVSNPGCLRLPVEVVEGGGVSDPRNKTLMTMFSLIGRGDKAGSGFDVFRKAAKYAGASGPEIVEFLDPDRTKLTLHLQPEIDYVVNGVNVVNRSGKDVVNVVSGDGDNVTAPVELDSSFESLIVRRIREDSASTASSIADELGISTRQAQRYLRRLREGGRIERVGSTRGHWEVRE